MQPNQNYYPRLLDILPLDKIPEPFRFIENGLEIVLDSVFFTELQSAQSRTKDQGFYRLTLFTYNSIGIQFPGTNMSLILNPNVIPGVGLTSSTPVVFEYSAPVLSYLSEFNSLEFAADPISYFNLILDILGLSGQDFLAGLISKIGADPDPIGDFVNKYNAIHTAQPIVPIVSTEDSEIVRDLAEQINNYSTVDLFQTLFEDFIITAGNLENVFAAIFDTFREWIGDIDTERLEKIFIPRFSISIEDLSVGLSFPPNILRQLDPVTLEPLTDGQGDNVPSVLKFNVGSLKYSTDLGFEFENENSFDLPISEIAKTGFHLSLSGMKLDLSRTKNIPEADADGRPVDFIGAYITEGIIGFPAFWNHDDENSTGQIIARNLLVGTGGISGTLGLEAKTNGNPAPLICAKLGSGFKLCLTAFSIEFQQNAIIGSNISGLMRIPGFEDANGNDAEIEIDVHIGQDGDFSVTATEPDGIPIRIPNVLQFNLTSAGIGREDDRWFLKISGSMEFINPTIATLFPAKIDFQEIIIWDDGQFEIKGGGLELPQALSLKFPPVELSVTAIHLGSTERDYDNGGTPVLRKYKYFGLDGSVKVDPGGVEAKGKGIQVYFSSDNSVLPLDIFVRIESLRIDIIIPGDADPKDATVIIAGFLSVKDPPPGFPGTEYAGGVSIDMPQAGIGGAAAMRFNPKVPYFIVDIEVEISKAIPLGSTGMGLYGFRGLLGKYFVATKNAAEVEASEPWWKYYKAKIANDYKEGVQISKFDPIGGFAVGLGVSLATSTDGGKIFSSKIFLLLSLRELFMLQGQAAILSDRIKLNDPNDPPFFALLVITRESIEAALGVNYLIPDDKSTPGDIATVQGVLELGFFFRDSSAWYLNIGRDLPESYRIQVRLFDLFDVYFYFMLSAQGIRTGAGASFELDKKFGPLRAYLYAYLDIAAKVAFKPKQFGGSIALGGGVELSIFGLGFGISVAASLAAEAPEPFVITGSFEVCIKVLKKERCAKFELTWERNNNVDTSEIGLINRAEVGNAAQAVNIQTKETFAINFVKESSGLLYRGTSNPANWAPPAPNDPAWNGSFDNHIIPLDCFIDIDFKNGMNPNGNPSTDRFGKTGGAEYSRYVAPQQGKTPRVKHDFVAEDIFIYAWNPTLSQWEEYDIYDALTPMDDLPFIDPMLIDSLNLKQGYWQKEDPNKFNKLRILAQTPLSYITQTSGEFIPENNGVTAESIFCEEEPREKCCVHMKDYLPRRKDERREQTDDFTSVDSPGKLAPVDLKANTFSVKNLAVIAADEPYFFHCLTFTMEEQDAAIVQTNMSHLGESVAIAIPDGSCLEIKFQEPVTCIDFTMYTMAETVNVEYYRLVLDPNSASGLDVIEELITVDTFTPADLNAVVQYLDPNNPVDKICIENGECPEGTVLPELCDGELTMEAEQLEIFLSTLVSTQDILLPGFQLNDESHNPVYNGVFMNSPLYQYPGGKQIPLTYQLVKQSSTSIEFVINDREKYKCTFSLSSGAEINWSSVTSMTNLRPDPDNLVTGNNYTFLIDAILSDGTVRTLKGKTSCYNIITCHAHCSTYLFKLCMLSELDYAYNQTLPSNAQVAAETESMMDALEKTFQPIWRPNTTFAIAIKTNEAVSGGGSNNHRNTFYYGFRTKGPIGHFHSYLDNANNEVIREDYQDLLDANREDAYQLSKLQHYVDYRRSYPNADGDLLNAKPLFYKDPRLLLFYKKQYVYAMFGNWDALSGNGAVGGGMSVVIQDAIEPLVPPVPTVSWALDDFCIMGKDVQAINNMIQNSDPSDCPPDSLDQNSVNTQVDIDELKPLKLYTAIFSNSYQRDADAGTPTTTREVHRYPFRTSRYGRFDEQVNSYQLAIDASTSTVLKTAIFEVGKVIPAANLSLAAGMISPVPTDDLLQDYADLIERVLQGAFKLGTLHPAISTEFNVVRNTEPGGNVLGIWIRCPEPFNDPKLPASEMQTTIRLSVDGDSEANYQAIFSKDAREVFITNTNASLNMPIGEYSFTFDYREWNGTQNITAATVPVTFTVSI